MSTIIQISIFIPELPQALTGNRAIICQPILKLWLALENLS